MSAVYAFEVNVSGEEWATIINARSAGRAKAEYFRGVHESWPSIPFTAVRCRRIGAPFSSDDFLRVASNRGTSFLCGDRVQVGIGHGVIVGHNSSANFDVLFDDDSPEYPGQRLNVHPASVALRSQGASEDRQ